ncbi:hypothetical protein PIB30_090137 [Stylosanthes scabra]|uniref:Uncharacterized protein n=1 Tax=Stylosanthes scabra TaxID=79078 RepID=A0ABU6TTQ2_9FABA|nr:hypothetical protein [Stylosanthes scabra]
MASSSSVSVFDNYRFKSAFNEELYNSIVKNKKVIAECCIDLDDDEYPEVQEQISLRGWRRLAAPKQEISIDLIHEKEHDQQLDQVLADLCIPGATWKLSTGQLRVPIQLRRQELNPVARGWHEFSIHSLIPSSSRSEIPGIKEKGKLGFPSTIFKLCKERRQQENEEEDEPMPQAEEGNEEGNEGQAHDYDYHHQPEYEQPQPDFEHHQEFNEPLVQPPPIMFQLTQINIKKTLIALKLSCRT